MRIRFGYVGFWSLGLACAAGTLAGTASAEPAPETAGPASAGPVSNAPAGALSWKWTLGREQRWVCTASRSGKVEGAATVEWSQQERVVVLQKVTAAAPDGSADLEFTILSARVEIVSLLGSTTLDTAAPDPSTTVDPAGVLRKLVGKKVTCHVDATGRVTAAGGGKPLLDELKLSYAKDPKMTAIVAQFAPTFDDELLRVRLDRVLGILPTESQAAAGGEWATEGGKACDIDLPGLGVLALSDRHTMETATSQAQRVIKTTTTATLGKPKVGESPLAVVYVISLDKAEGETRTTIDTAGGELIGSEASMSYTVKFAPKPGNAPPPPMTQVVEQKVKVERESK